MMESNLSRGIVFGLAGCVIGMSTGVAALGGAVNGAVVFGPIGFLLGWIFPWRKHQGGSDGTSQTANLVSPDQPKSDFGHVEKSLNDMVPIAGRMLGAVCYLQMKLLIAVGLMPFLQRYPWALVGIAFLLLAFLFPLGVVFTISGLAAMIQNASARDQFLVNLGSPPPA